MKTRVTKWVVQDPGSRGQRSYEFVNEAAAHVKAQAIGSVAQRWDGVIWRGSAREIWEIDAEDDPPARLKR